MSDSDHKDKKYVAKLHVDMVFIGSQDLPGHELHVVTHSISMEGITILSNYNLQKNQEMHLRLHIPATHAGHAEKYVIMRGKVNYTIYDSSAEEFRTYIRILSFNDPESKILLSQKMME
ncbi:MAG: hypothetical protein WC091_18910 [Sulfuricellaceae bacterium]